MMTMRFLILFFVVWAGVSLSPSVVSARTEGIAVVVNDGVITTSDVNDRMRLIMASSGLSNTEDIRMRLKPQIVASLVDEEIMLQEARKLGISVTPEEIQAGFATIAKQNNQDSEVFKQMLERGGINTSTMKRQIEAQVAWGKVVQAQVRPQITVSDFDIDDVMTRIDDNQGKKEYLAAEIVIPPDSQINDQNAAQLAKRLVSEMRGGKVRFSQIAQQFSKAAGAAQGGDLGWIQQGQLPQELDEVLQTLEVGQISDPVKSPAGYHIPLVRETREITDENTPTRDEIRSTIGMQRLDRMQRRYLMDLKAAAFIEARE